MQVVMNFGESWQGVEVEASCSGLKNEGGGMKYREQWITFLRSWP